MADRLAVDEACAGQMALRDGLIAAREAEVHAVLPQAEAAAEVYGLILPRPPGLGLTLGRGEVVRPDGVRLALDPARPLLMLGRPVQEDLCLLQAEGSVEPVLTAAILCFPVGRTLAEKLRRPLPRIHAPVAKYDDEVSRRVQRLMAAIRPETPLWRANAHHSRVPLFNPLSEAANRLRVDDDKPWIRCERQCLIQLPASRAVCSRSTPVWWRRAT